MCASDCRCDAKGGKAAVVGLSRESHRAVKDMNEPRRRDGAKVDAKVIHGWRMNETQKETMMVLQERAPVTSSRVVAVGALVLCCLFWGYSFPVMQFANVAFERHMLPIDASEAQRLGSRGLFNGVRFGLA